MDEDESSVLARRARIKIVAGAKVSDDGSHMLLKLQSASQHETVLAIPINEAARLIDLVAYALTRSTELARHRRNKQRLFRALACTVGKEPLSEDVVLSIKLPTGGILSFRLQPSIAIDRRMITSPRFRSMSFQRSAQPSPRRQPVAASTHR